MRLGEMNNLSAEKLNQDMQQRVGWNFGDLSRVTVEQASAMLENIDNKLAVFKTTSKLHESEKSTAYNGMMLAKQVLEAHISEAAQNPYAVGMAQAMKSTGDTPPLKKSTIKKAHKIAKAVAKEGVDGSAKVDPKAVMQAVKAVKTFNAAHKKASELYDAGKEKQADRYTDMADEASKQFFAIVAPETPKVDQDLNIYGWPEASKEWVMGWFVDEAQAVLEDEVGVNEAYSANEQAVDDAFENIMDRLLNMAKVMREDGALAKNVASIGGDPSYMQDAYHAIHSAYDDVAEAHRGALGHIMDESAKPVLEDEVGQAESIMAAQDMVDRIQGMLEDVGEMLNEDLPPLTDSLRRSNSADAAASFNTTANSALNSLMEAVRSAREEMANAVGMLSGQEPTPMGGEAELDLDVEEPSADSDEEFDLDDFEASDAAVGGDEPLGRAKRD